VSPATARGLEGHAPTGGRCSAPGLVVGEQALLKRSRTRLPRGVICQPQSLQPSAFAEDLKPEEPRLGQRDRRLGDATGKGVPAALVMSTTLGMLRLAAQSYSSPGQILQQVNEALFPYIPSNMFVTCFYAVLDPESGLLRYANAGHDLPYLHHHDGEAKELRARGMPLGLMSSMGYEEMELVLEAGESVLFYSDGLVEAHDPEGEMFGFPRLRALVAEHAEERSLGECLLGELYSFVGEGWEQEDDITLVTLRCSAPLS
jgi:serine phosphatase RsbU (regulator of sigma subunit)